MTDTVPEPSGYQATAANLRSIADALDTLPHGNAPYATLSILPAEKTVEAIDAVALAVLGKAGVTRRDSDGWRHIAEGRSGGAWVSIHALVPGPPDERDLELERLRAEVETLRADHAGQLYSRADDEADDPTPVSPARGLHAGAVLSGIADDGHKLGATGKPRDRRTCVDPGDQEHDHAMCEDVVAEEQGLVDETDVPHDVLVARGLIDDDGELTDAGQESLRSAIANSLVDATGITQGWHDGQVQAPAEGPLRRIAGREAGQVDETLSAPISHEPIGGSVGGPGENSAECDCGTVFDGFDTVAEANRMLALHIEAATSPTGLTKAADESRGPLAFTTPVVTYFSFGHGQSDPDTGKRLLDHYVTVVAPTYDGCREAMLSSRFGREWSMEYLAGKASVTEWVRGWTEHEVIVAAGTDQELAEAALIAAFNVLAVDEAVTLIRCGCGPEHGPQCTQGR